MAATKLENGDVAFSENHIIELHAEKDAVYTYVPGLIPTQTIIDEYHARVVEKINKYGAQRLWAYKSLADEFNNYVKTTRVVKSQYIPNLLLFVVETAPLLNNTVAVNIAILVSAFKQLYTKYLSYYNLLFGPNQRVSFAFEVIASKEPRIGAHYEAFCRFPCKTTARYLQKSIHISSTILSDTQITRKELSRVLDSHWRALFPEKRVLPTLPNTNAFTLPASVASIIERLHALTQPLAAWWNIQEFRPRLFVTSTDLPEIHAFLLGPSETTAAALVKVIQPSFETTPLGWWKKHVASWYKKEFSTTKKLQPNLSIVDYQGPWKQFLSWYSTHKEDIRVLLDLYPDYTRIFRLFLQDPTQQRWKSLRDFQHPLAIPLAQEFPMFGEKKDPATALACVRFAKVLEASKLASTYRGVTWHKEELNACKKLKPYNDALAVLEHPLVSEKAANHLEIILTKAMAVLPWLLKLQRIDTLETWNKFSFWVTALETTDAKNICTLMAGIKARSVKFAHLTDIRSLAEWDDAICDDIRERIEAL